MLGTPAFVEFALQWWPELDATEVLSWLRDLSFLLRIGEGVVSCEDADLLTASWQAHPAGSWSMEDIAARRAALPARRPAWSTRTRRSTRSRTWSTRTCPS